MTDSLTIQPGRAPAYASAEIGFSCRLPLLVLFVSAAVWLVIGSAFALIASIKFHSPDFLANTAWLTYGRVYPAYLNSVLYGCCVQAGLGIMLWVFTHLGLTPLPQRILVTVGASLWNLGVTIGVVGILAGDSTGFEMLEMPSYGAIFAFLGYLFVGIWAVVCFHRRQIRPLYVSQWYLFAALFWFPWIFSTAQILLGTFPVRGMAQAVIAWWYADNLLVVWLGLTGLAAVFYFLPKLLGRELPSHYLALITFWMLVTFGSWAGIPNTAPLPAWLPTLSTVSSVLLLVPILAILLNIHRTLFPGTPTPALKPTLTAADKASLRFIVFGSIAFGVAGLMVVAGALLDSNQLLQLTWFHTAQRELIFYGFFVMIIFGAVYRVLPQLTATTLPWPKFIGLHFWLAAAGVVLVALPFALAGITQVGQLADPSIDGVKLGRATLPFLRASTVGLLLLAVGHVLFLANLAGLVIRFYRAKAAAAYERMTADLFRTAGAKP
jgi:cytochrome c oxidase cbb3-type subunit I